MTEFVGKKGSEYKFQNEIIQEMLVNGWKLGEPSGYNRELALYPEDLVGFVKDTQDAQWEKYRIYNQDKG